VGSALSPWEKRTSPIALGRLVLSLLVLLTARRIRLRAGRVLPDSVNPRGMGLIAPLELLKGGVAVLSRFRHAA